MQQVI